MIDHEQQRDHAEEAYWRHYCPECDAPHCAEADRTHPHADPDEVTQ